MEQNSKEKAMFEHANAILSTFKGKEYDGESLMVILTYVLVNIVHSAIEQNGYAKCMYWFTELVRNVQYILKNQN